MSINFDSGPLGPHSARLTAKTDVSLSSADGCWNNFSFRLTQKSLSRTPVLQIFHGQTINKQKLEKRSGYGLDDPDFESRQDKRFFSSPKCPVPLWVPPSFLFNRNQGIFPGAKSGTGDKFTTHLHYPEPSLTHCGRVTQICVFNTVKLGTSASSPQCHSTKGNVSRGITPSSTTRVFGEYFLKISVHENSQRICYKFLKKHSIKVD